MASNNEHYRARAIEDALGDQLDGYFFSADLKVKKSNPQFFELLLEKLNLPASDVAFVDNDKQNVEAAQEVGLEARQFEERLLSVWPERTPVTDLKIR